MLQRLAPSITTFWHTSFFSLSKCSFVPLTWAWTCSQTYTDRTLQPPCCIQMQVPTSNACFAQSDLAKFFQLFVSIWVQFLWDILHPEQSSAVLSTGFLHPAYGQQGVCNGSPPERLHFLLQTMERGTQRQPGHDRGQEDREIIASGLITCLLSECSTEGQRS